jgi:hypothetical protein
MFHVPDEGRSGFRSPILETRVFDATESAGFSMQGSSGTYELTGLPAGRYTLRFQGSRPGEHGDASEIELKKDGQELDSSPGEPLSELKLSIKIAGQEKLPDRLFVALRDSRLRTVRFDQVDPQGEVRFEALAAGKYVIVAGSQNTAYSVVQTISQGIASSGNSVSVTPGSSGATSVLLVGGTATVEGFVKRGAKAAPGMMVVLVPENPEANLELFRRDQSDLDGSFVLRGVVPGKYTVIAIEDGWTVDWSRPAVLARYTPRGQTLGLPQRTQASFHLPEALQVQPK